MQYFLLVYPMESWQNTMKTEEENVEVKGCENVQSKYKNVRKEETPSKWSNKNFCIFTNPTYT